MDRRDFGKTFAGSIVGAGYEGAFLPHHMPRYPGDPGKLQAYAFG